MEQLLNSAPTRSMRLSKTAKSSWAPTTTVSDSRKTTSTPPQPRGFAWHYESSSLLSPVICSEELKIPAALRRLGRGNRPVPDCRRQHVVLLKLLNNCLSAYSMSQR